MKNYGFQSTPKTQPCIIDSIPYGHRIGTKRIFVKRGQPFYMECVSLRGSWRNW